MQSFGLSFPSLQPSHYLGILHFSVLTLAYCEQLALSLTVSISPNLINLTVRASRTPSVHVSCSASCSQRVQKMQMTKMCSADLTSGNAELQNNIY